MAKAAKGKFYEAIKPGYDPRDDKESKNGDWLKLKSGEPIDVTCLIDETEILTCEQCAIWLDEGNSPVWTYLGPGDPFHDLKVDKRYKAFLPVLTEEGEVKVWGMTKSSHRQLLDIADAAELKGMVLRLKRTGNGLGTRYSIVPKGTRKDVSRIEVPDVISMLGPLTIEGVQELIAEKLGKSSYEEVLDAYRGKRPKATKKREVEDEEEDLEEVDLM